MTRNPQHINQLITFSVADISILKEVARHWMKLRLCWEVDNGFVPGFSFIESWNPLDSIKKLEREYGAASSATLVVRSLPVIDPSGMGWQSECSLCFVEFVFLQEMMVAAVSGTLNQFWVNDGVVMSEVMVARLSHAWTCHSAAKALADKLWLGYQSVESCKAPVELLAEYGNRFEGVRYA